MTINGASSMPESVTGIQLARGIGVQEARGFWADAWAQVLRRPGAVAALGWLGMVAFCAVSAPLLASGHPLVLRTVTPEGPGPRSYPFFRNLEAGDVVILCGALIAVPWILLRRKGRAPRLGAAIFGAALAALVVIGSNLVHSQMDQRDPAPWALALRNLDHPLIELGPSPSALRRLLHTISAASLVIAASFAAVSLAVGLAPPVLAPWGRRIAVPAIVAGLAAVAVILTWGRPLPVFDTVDKELLGQVRATYTIIPFPPAQRFTAADRQPPWTSLSEAMHLPPGAAPAARRFYLGTDAFGQDVLTVLISACRLAISIGVVSTGIAVRIGVTMGALSTAIPVE